jgi:signal transduction histidine kinase
MRRDGDRLLIVVSDNGRGFDATQALEHRGGVLHFGLFAVQERIKNLGGVMDIQSEAGAGTRVSLSIPIVATPTTQQDPGGTDANQIITG